MGKADYDDSSPAELRPEERLDDDFIPDNALPLCAKCFKPCDPLQYYCDKCDSYDAINPLTPYIAFVNIPFYFGFYFTMWRKIWADDETSIIVKVFYLLVILIFYRVILIVGLPAYLICKVPQKRARNALLVIFFLGLIALSIFYAYTGWPFRRVPIF